MDNKSLSHTRWNCQYHIVFIPKYRRKVKHGKYKVEIWNILKKLSEYKKAEIIVGAVCSLVCKYSNKAQCCRILRISERKIGTDDIR